MTGRVVAVTGTGEAGHTGGLCEGWGGPHRIQGREPLVAVPPPPAPAADPRARSIAHLLGGSSHVTRRDLVRDEVKP